ncbi:MAG: serine/threonine protein kinase [Deltaproteobacteria bacterium]|nr:serine/threonine protein kinase [Deltaproteobacteria bacterium]
MDALEVKDPFIGRVIAGKYEILRRLGAGGMGAVYHARHTQTHGDHAVKFLHGTAVGDQAAVRRFQIEAQNAAALRHTNTIRVTDFGVDEGLFYLVMEYLEGHALSDVLQDQGPLPWPRVVHILRQILKSLWEAHEHAKKIIHRDIKPANIYLVDLPGDPDQVRVLDFGISRALESSGAGTQGLLGTPFYMAPELWRGEPVDARTDLYALGCVAFQMLAGKPPFVPPPSASDSIFPLLDMHLNVPPPVLGRLVPGVPAALADWVDSLLAKDRDDRPAGARAALDALDRALAASDSPRTDVALGPVAMADTMEGERRAAPARAIDVRAPTATAPRSAVTDTVAPGPSPAPAPRRQGGRGWVWPVIIAVLVVGLGGALAVVLSSKQTPTPGGGDPVIEVGTRPLDPDEPILDPDEPPVVEALEPLPSHHASYGPHLLTYRTRLSAADHVDDDGEDLLRASEVLVRDRVRFLLGVGDREDQDDGQLKHTPGALAELGPYFDRFVDATTAHAILTGTPLVEVAIYQDGIVVRVVPE